MIYINGIGCVSPQVGFDDLLQKEEEINQSEPLLSLAPNYSQYLEPNAARRLSKVIKNSWCATADALKQAAVQQVDEIISATAMGCLADTTTFLNRIKDFPEVVSPTAFIQSTHNTIAGFAALQLKCYGLNKTIAQRNFSFEHALLDAQINTEKNGNVLLIAYDELNSELATIFNKIATQTNSKIKFGEASVATVLAGEQSEKNLCKLITVGTITGKKTEDALTVFIEENKVDLSSIDIVMSGYNGLESYDSQYHEINNKHFKAQTILQYKNLCGELFTASAYAFYLAANILAKQKIPKQCVMKRGNPAMNKILIHNYFEDKHAFILLER